MNRIDYTTKTQAEIEFTSEVMKDYKWNIDRSKLGDAIVEMTIYKSILNAHEQLCKLVDHTFYDKFLEATQKNGKKIAFAEKVIAYLQSNDDSIDPRIEKLLTKLSTKKDIPIEKICKYIDGVNRIADSDPNMATTAVLAQITDTLKDLQTQHLLIAPEFHNYGLSANKLFKTYYNNPSLSDISKRNDLSEQILQDGREQTSILFLETAFDGDTIAIDKLIEEGHTQAAIIMNTDSMEKDLFAILDSHKKPTPFQINYVNSRDHSPELTHRLSRLISMNSHDSIFCLKDCIPRSLVHTDLEKIQKYLIYMCDLRAKHQLSVLGGFICFGNRHLTFSIDEKNTISLFNQYGVKWDGQTPYLGNFGTVKDAASHLHTALHKEENNHNSKEELVFIPVCNRYVFESMNNSVNI